MPDATRHPRPDDDARTPGWAKLFWITILALVVLFVVLHLMGGGLGHLHQ